MIPRGSMSKISFNQVSLMSTILDIPFVCVKRVGIAMAQTKTCKSWLLPQRCGNFEKVATTAVPGGKKAAPPFFFYPASLYINTNPKTPVVANIKSCHRAAKFFCENCISQKSLWIRYSKYFTHKVIGAHFCLMNDQKPAACRRV